MPRVVKYWSASDAVRLRDSAVSCFWRSVWSAGPETAPVSDTVTVELAANQVAAALLARVPPCAAWI